ncbi:cytochrome c553 [Caulobacter ginsengisoli]|uniref:Cytochrome c553 n=1 Tax=Caulobacter ginsengisoli TaxID=400775 RepID=A0ABU0ISU9_9CAUL|nr:cytochrome c [Caulobacter ginsengisoli]MDQ0464505.1 cytochrome c553 [Caulobacter ginsengisoli]
MVSVRRWAVRGVIALAGIVLFVAVGVWISSQLVIEKRWPIPAGGVAAARDPGAAARGKLLATRFGCTDCHGGDLTGSKFFDDPQIARFWAPNLTLVAGKYSDAQLDHALRAGVRPSGQGLWVMPSEMLMRLTDAETADLIAYLRSLKPVGEARPAKLIRAKGRIGVLIGKFKAAPSLVAEIQGQPLPDYGPGLAEGRRLARACVECHGSQLQGGALAEAPDLNIAAAYDPADFKRLLRTGIAAGNRRLGLMSESAPIRFRNLSDAEIEALQAYLKARVERQPPA